MSYTEVQGNPIFVDLIAASNDTGWSISGNTAVHSSCNAGKMYLLNYPVVSGTSYTITYKVVSISGGGVNVAIGNTNGASITTPQFVTQTIVASGTETWFYSDANCVIQLFDIQVNDNTINNQSQDTIAYSEITGKWGSFYTITPDIGTSLFTDAYVVKQGQIYRQQHNSLNRGNFFGQQFVATIIFSSNQQPTLQKTFSSINYQANELLVSPSRGIETSNGQVSELIASDFLQQTLDDGITVENIYDVEGIYDASFIRDMNVDAINGDILQGRYMTIGLTTNSPSLPLNLFSTEIIYSHSYSNTR